MEQRLRHRGDKISGRLRFPKLGCAERRLPLARDIGFQFYSSDFVEDGRKREANWLEGAWQDSICMGILEDDWLQDKRVSESS